MNLNEKVEELAKITAALKNEINELKGKDVNMRLDELEAEQEDLKNDILDLRHSLMQQNELILSFIRQHNDKLMETIEADKLTTQLVFTRKISQYSKIFPIKSLKELDALDALINDNNVNELIAVVHQLLAPHGIVKNIETVMSVECIMECNVDGHHNKRRLLNSKKFMDLLFQAAYYDGYSHKMFLEHVRRGFKMVKNRHNKNLCRHRQMERQRLEQQSVNDSLEVEEIITDDFIKTEEIYFE
ncbi:hypothetical protein FF38_12073 [Lucilia cuprina]|uniref:DUF4806 domain-containing protein n=1 Tax=Lucilia cuprina TaxID=7375 RepID=A0A0L0BPF9_LUCCU|nr:hypothetical protein CVS40_1901 [Lucilia cuprina]KNC21937.1 hypothetical protein FF38_12073 [Lucilia cuprina]